MRAGVKLGETIPAATERIQACLDRSCKHDLWLAAHPPLVRRPPLVHSPPPPSMGGTHCLLRRS